MLAPLTNRFTHMPQMALIHSPDVDPERAPCLFLPPMFSTEGSIVCIRGTRLIASVSPGSPVDPLLFFAHPWHCRVCSSRKREVLSPSWLPRSSCPVPGVVLNAEWGGGSVRCRKNTGGRDSRFSPAGPPWISGFLSLACCCPTRQVFRYTMRHPLEKSC